MFTLKRKCIAILTLSTIMIMLHSCSSGDDNTVPIMNDSNDDPPADTNPLPNQTTTYTGNVKAIIDGQCNSCHSNPPRNGAPIPLVTFQDVVFAANNRDLTGRVSTTIERSVMPPDGRLPQATVDIILDWSADGLLEN